VREIELVPGLRTSVLGLGTANFGARLRERERQRLLEAALAAGIRHVDTAPLYGDGSAEASVGRFVARHRDEVTVTAKVGLLPPRGGRAAAVLRRLGGGAARRVGPADARGSLERTLRALRTDRVDLLLLHEIPSGQLDEWRAFLTDAVARGEARATGIATTPEASAQILAAGDADFPAVVQVAVGTPVPSERAAIFHSVFAHGSTIAAALAAHPRAVVLFASTQPERVAANATLAR